MSPRISWVAAARRNLGTISTLNPDFVLFIVEGCAKLPPTWVRVRHDNMIVSPLELGILSGVGLPDREASLRRFGLVGLVSKAVPALPAISYGGIGMIAITDTILEREYGGKMSRLGDISLRVSFRGVGDIANMLKVTNSSKLKTCTELIAIMRNKETKNKLTSALPDKHPLNLLISRWLAVVWFH